MCPYEVSPVAFIEAMKIWALEEGHAPDSIIGEIEQVVNTGYAFPLTSNTERQRQQLGLEPIRANENLKAIAKGTGLLEDLVHLLGYVLVVEELLGLVEHLSAGGAHGDHRQPLLLRQPQVDRRHGKGLGLVDGVDPAVLGEDVHELHERRRRQAPGRCS